MLTYLCGFMCMQHLHDCYCVELSVQSCRLHPFAVGQCLMCMCVSTVCVYVSVFENSQFMIDLYSQIHTHTLACTLTKLHLGQLQKLVLNHIKCFKYKSFFFFSFWSV